MKTNTENITACPCFESISQRWLLISQLWRGRLLCLHVPFCLWPRKGIKELCDQPKVTQPVSGQRWPMFSPQGSTFCLSYYLLKFSSPGLPSEIAQLFHTKMAKVLVNKQPVLLSRLLCEPALFNTPGRKREFSLLLICSFAG